MSPLCRNASFLRLACPHKGTPVFDRLDAVLRSIPAAAREGMAGWCRARLIAIAWQSEMDEHWAYAWALGQKDATREGKAVFVPTQTLANDEAKRGLRVPVELLSDTDQHKAGTRMMVPASVAFDLGAGLDLTLLKYGGDFARGGYSELQMAAAREGQLVRALTPEEWSEELVRDARIDRLEAA